MSVQTQIDRIKAAKTDISAAISEKGVTVPSTTKIDGMAAHIRSISQAEDLDSVLDTQETKLNELLTILDGKAAGGGASIETCEVTLINCQDFYMSGMIPTRWGRFAAPGQVAESERTLTCEKACIILTDFNNWFVTYGGLIASGNAVINDIGYEGAGVIIDLTNADDVVTIEFVG